MVYEFQSIDHVQLAAPTGSEEEARKFYKGILGFKEIEKPEALKKNGGVWFQYGQIHVHIGVEEPFQPARKAHPAFSIKNLDSFIAHLKKLEIEYKTDNRLPGAKRIHLFDPFGNRLEIIEWI